MREKLTRRDRDLLHVVKRERGEHGTEDLLLGDLHIVVHSAEYSGFDEVTVIAVDRGALSAGKQSRALFLPASI